jgi:tetratricopeptide (TPR) repeat protein
MVRQRELAGSLAAQGKLSDAVAAAQEALRLSGGRDHAAAFLLATLYYDLGRLPEAEQLVDALVPTRPGDRALLVIQGLVKLDLGNFEDAEPALTKAAEGDASLPWARLGGAVLLRARGRVDEAETALEKLVSDKPDWTLAQFQLGVTRLAKNQPQSALMAFGAAESSAGRSLEVRLRTARVLLTVNQPSLAIDRARPLLQTSVGPAARALIVQAELSRNAPDRAERVLRDAVDATPKDAIARLQLGRFYLDRGRARDAVAQFDAAARARPDAPEPLAAKADAHLALGEPAEAVRAGEQVITLRPHDAHSYLVLGSVFERLGRTADALATYQRLLEKAPNHLGVVRAMAAVFAREGRTTDAVKLLSEAAAAHPRSPLPLVDIAQISERTGNLPAAVAAYRNALLRAPDDVSLLNNLAYLLAKNRTTLSEAEVLAERAHHKRPRNGAIADTLGWILYQQRSLDRASRLLEQAASALPANPEVQYHLAVVYAEQGKRTEARQALERALKGPRFAETADAQKLLDSLR